MLISFSWKANTLADHFLRLGSMFTCADLTFADRPNRSRTCRSSSAGGVEERDGCCDISAALICDQ